MEPNCTREPKLREWSIIGVSFAILFPPLSSSFDPRVTPMQNWAVDTGSKSSEKNYLSGERTGKRDHSELKSMGDTHLFFFIVLLFYVIKVPGGEKKETDAERNIWRNLLKAINLEIHEAQQTLNSTNSKKSMHRHIATK